MPAVDRPEQLRKLIDLRVVRIFHAQREGLAYLGYEFGCKWDGEHGLGAMTHGSRVIEVGGADTAILEWIAENDLKQS